MAKLDDQIKDMIKEELGLYDSEGRRTANEIRDLIQSELEMRPKTTHKLMNAIDSSRSTIKRHCSHLQKLDVIKEISLEETKYWKKKSKQ